MIISGITKYIKTVSLIAKSPKTVNIALRKPLKVDNSFTINDSNDVISISEFSIAPSGQERRTVSHENSRSTVRSINKTVFKKFNSNMQLTNKDEHMQKYLFETRNGREIRRKIGLPPIQQFHRKSFSLTRLNPLNEFLFGRLKKIEESDEKLRYQPTYQLGPKTKFNSRMAQPLIQELLNNFIDIINVEQVMSSRSSIKSALDHLCTLSEQPILKLLYAIRIFNL